MVACGNDSTSSGAVEVGEKEWKKSETGLPADDLALNAIPDADVFGKVRWLLTTLQSEYNRTEGLMPNTGKVTVLLDENLTMTIRNTFGGRTYESRANLKDLNPASESVGIIVDELPGEFPGMKFFVLDGSAKVEKLENGSVKSKSDHLEIIMGDRIAIENSVTAMLMAIQTAHGQL